MKITKLAVFPALFVGALAALSLASRPGATAQAQEEYDYESESESEYDYETPTVSVPPLDPNGDALPGKCKWICNAAGTFDYWGNKCPGSNKDLCENPPASEYDGDGKCRFAGRAINTDCNILGIPSASPWP